LHLAVEPLLQKTNLANGFSRQQVWQQQKMHGTYELEHWHCWRACFKSRRCLGPRYS